MHWLNEFFLKKNRVLFLFFITYFVFHFGLLYFGGIFRSFDFQNLYEPKAEKLIEWVHGQSNFPLAEMGYGIIFHFNYFLFIGFCFLLFGKGCYFVIVSLQIFLSFFSSLLPVFSSRPLRRRYRQ